jgi:thymidylate synthase
LEKKAMKQYLDLLVDILENGEERSDRTGVGTKSVFGRQLRFDLRSGFPAVTTKRLAWKSVVSELLWFIEGSGDERRLAEILHGTRDDDKTTIWTANAQAPYWEKRASFYRDLGRVYGVQWRSWRRPSPEHAKEIEINDWYGAVPLALDIKHKPEVDQLANLIDGIKKDPMGRRHILTAWNPGELDMMALPPCHVLCQFYVNSKHELSCHMYQRSVDVFLGLPFNIASYALLTHMIAKVCEMGVGELIISSGDTHIYLNHVDQVNEQMKREPLELPNLWLNPNVTSIDGFTMDDIKLLDYKCHDILKAPMAV